MFNMINNDKCSFNDKSFEKIEKKMKKTCIESMIIYSFVTIP